MRFLVLVDSFLSTSKMDRPVADPEVSPTIQIIASEKKKKNTGTQSSREKTCLVHREKDVTKCYAYWEKKVVTYNLMSYLSYALR